MPHSNITPGPDPSLWVPSQLLLRPDGGERPTLADHPELSLAAREEAKQVLQGGRKLDALIAAAAGPRSTAIDGCNQLKQAIYLLAARSQRILRERHGHQRSWADMARLLGEPEEILRRAHADIVVNLLAHVPGPLDRREGYGPDG